MSKVRIVKLLDPIENNVTIAGITVKAEDGTPTVTTVTELNVANGALTNNGSNSVSIDYDSRYVNVTGDNLEGNLTADAGVLIDGYDVSVEFASIDTGIDGGAF